MKKCIALICVFALAFTFAACSKNRKSSGNGIEYQSASKENSKIIKLLLSPYGDKEYLLTGEVKENYVSVTSDGNFTFSDLDFISENEKVAKIKYVSTPLDGCVYYSIEGVRHGTTFVYIRSKDGSVRSTKIKVTVDKETVATTTTISLRSYSYSRTSTTEETSSETSSATSGADTTSSETNSTSKPSKPSTQASTHSSTHTASTTSSSSRQTTRPTQRTTTRRRFR